MRPGSPFPVPKRGNRLLLELDLTRPLLETPPTSPVAAMRARHAITLRSVVEALGKAAKDPQVAGLVAHVGHRQPTLAQADELRAAVRAFAASGKPTVCWAETFGEMGPGTVGYHVAAAFGVVWVQPSGDVGLTGMSAQAVFVRDTLDKLGVEPQVAQREEYKTAANMFVETQMTPAHREMLSRIVESAMETVVGDVAHDRGLAPEAVRDCVDAAPLSAQEARERGLVDRIGYRDEVFADLRGRLGEVDLKFVERYGKGLAAVAAAAPRRNRPVVALVQASGPIHLGRSRPSLMSQHSVGSENVGAALRAAAEDDDVKAVVIRVDSPGGSYVASDAIRREVHVLRRTGKPVVASMASVAASGGYYIAMPADEIVAEPGTLTGSIGVFAGKQVVREALRRAGVNSETVTVGRNADMFSAQRPFDEDEWLRLEAWLDRVYADFTAKAAEDRRMDVERLRGLAKGRVWTGADAHRHRLVDTLGGLTDAVDAACRRAEVDRAAVHVRTLPRPNVLERLRPAENSDHPAAARLAAPLGLLEQALSGLGLPADGVLTMPFDIRLR
ncbi:MAG TPA: signal peptide peptidase SppA [Nocardioidaceae bacterium]|nr:signal peptide peptidase SppA [Nocardioidaceae bacterium]